MSNEQLTPQIQLMRQRVQALYQQGNTAPQQNDVLAAAFEELELALEQLQVAEARQRCKYEEWLNDRTALEMESQSFQHLFDNAPAGYLVTSLDGTIRKANPIAAKLLECPERNLIGRSIALFVPEGQRREFRGQIAQLAETDHIHEKELAMQSWEHTPLSIGLTVRAVRSKTSSRPLALHWLLRDISANDQVALELNERVVGLELKPSTPVVSQHKPRSDTHDSEITARARLSLLVTASIQLMSAHKLDALFDIVAQVVVPALADACVIDLADQRIETTQRLVVMHDPGSKDEVRIWRGNFTHRSREHTYKLDGADPLPSAIDISQREDLRAILGKHEPSSAIVAPLQVGERQLGSVTVIMSKVSRQYDYLDVALIEQLACQMSSALARLQHT